jgi:hypothetical protein
MTPNSQIPNSQIPNSLFPNSLFPNYLFPNSLLRIVPHCSSFNCSSFFAARYRIRFPAHPRSP